MTRSTWLRIASSALAIVVVASSGAAQWQEAKPGSGRAVITIPSEGQYRFGNDTIRREELQRRISDALDRAPAVIDVIVGEDVSYGTVKDAFVIMREIGYDRVRLAVIRGGAQSEALLEAMFVAPPEGVKRRESGLPPREDRESSAPSPATPPPPRRQPPPSSRQEGAAGWYLIPSPLDETDIVVTLMPGSAGDRMVTLNRREMPLSQLGASLAPILRSYREYDRNVVLTAPAEAPFGRVADVLRELEAAGTELARLPIEEFELPKTFRPLRRPPDLTETDDPAPSPPRVQRVSGGVLAGKAIQKPQPAYPAMAKSARIEGAVVVEVTVDEQGKVIMARAVSGHPLLRDAAVTAARGWTFTPTEMQGQPVKVIGTITFNFKAPPAPSGE